MRTFLEALERRRLLSISGVPIWVQQGPGPVINAQSSVGPQLNQATGAIQSVVPHPTNPNILYVASVQGGVWRTSNANWPNDGVDNDFNGITDNGDPNEEVAWTPLTDGQRTLANGDLVLDPTDPTRNTYWAATGAFSSLNSDDSAIGGLLKSHEGGVHWTPMAAATFAGLSINTALPLAVIDPTSGQQVVLVAVTDSYVNGGGLYRSTDGGTSFSRISGIGLLPATNVTDITTDPRQPNRIFAGVPGSGVFRSDDAGVNWINTGLAVGAGSIRISLATHFNPGAGTAALYAAEVAANGKLVQVSRASNITGSWTPITNLPTFHNGGSGMIHTSLVADPSDPFYVFIGADRNNFNNQGNLFQGDALTNSWIPLTGLLGATSTFPHADSRSMAFDAAGNIVESDDGGVYRLLNPNDLPGRGPRRWVSLIGNLASAETIGVAWDRLNQIVAEAQWDNGVNEQVSPGSAQFVQFQGGDGGFLTADNNNFSRTDRYHTGSNSSVDLFVRAFDASNGYLPLLSGPLGLSGLLPGDAAKSKSVWTNDSQPDRLLITPPSGKTASSISGSVSGIYESFDRGGSVTLLPIPNVGTAGNFGSAAYGSSIGGLLVPDATYLAYANRIYVRPPGSGAFVATAGQPPALAQSGVPGNRHIVVDPSDWRIAYLLDGYYRSRTVQSTVYRTIDGGASWTDVTGNLNASQSVYFSHGAITVFHSGSNTALLVGGQGGVYRLINPGTPGSTWSEFGANLPNADVFTLQYVPAKNTANGVRGDVLVAGLSGRGVWSIPNASSSLTQVSSVNAIGGATDDTYRVEQRGTRIHISETLGLAPTQEYDVEAGAITNLFFDGGSGNDTLIVDYSYGSPVPTGGITWTGGANSDGVQLIGTPAADSIVGLNSSIRLGTDANIVFLNNEHVSVSGGLGDDLITLNGSFAATSLFGGEGNDSVVLSNDLGNLDNLHGSVFFDGGIGSDVVTLKDTNNSISDTFSIDFGSLTRPGFAGLNFSSASEAISLLAGAGNSLFNIEGVNLNSNVFLDAGAGDDTLSVSPIRRDITSNLVGLLHWNGQSGANDRVFVNDSLTVNDATWILTGNTLGKANTFALAPFLTYLGSEQFNLTGGGGGTTYFVNGLAAGTPALIDAGAGNDRILIGASSGRLSDVQSVVIVTGGVGSDTVNLSDDNFGFFSTFNLGANIITRSSSGNSFGGVTYSGVESVNLFAGFGNDTFEVFDTAAGISTGLFGGGGSDTLGLTRTSKNLDTIAGPILFDGEADPDMVEVNDLANPFGDTFTLSSTQLTRAVFSGLTYANAESITVDLQDTSSTINVISTNPGQRVLLRGNDGADTMNFIDMASGTAVTVKSGAGDDTLNVNADGVGVATVILDEVESLGALNIGAGGKVQLTSSALTTQALNIISPGALDLTSGAMRIDYPVSGPSPFGLINAYLTAGYGGGTWIGPGVNSSTAATIPNRALGYAEAFELFSVFPALFAGQQVDKTSVLVRYTIAGDANLDGTVNFDDLLRLAQNYGQTPRSWAQSDFDFDGTVNFTDLLILAQRYGMSLAMGRITLMPKRRNDILDLFG